MEILYYNLQWMFTNILLALIPVLFGQIMYRNKNIFIALAAGIIWFLFLPNSIYLLTDFVNLVDDTKILSGLSLVIDIFMYAILMAIGVVTFIIAVVPFEKILIRTNKKINVFFSIFILNFFVGFGLVLGRFLRVNSWEVITNPLNVFVKSIAVIQIDKFFVWVVVFAIISQIVYFYFGSLLKLRHKAKAA